MVSLFSTGNINNKKKTKIRTDHLVLIQYNLIHFLNQIWPLTLALRTLESHTFQVMLERTEQTDIPLSRRVI